MKISPQIFLFKCVLYTAIVFFFTFGAVLMLDDAEALRCSDKRFNALAELISKNPTDSCLYGCTRIIHRKGNIRRELVFFIIVWFVKICINKFRNISTLKDFVESRLVRWSLEENLYGMLKFKY